MKENLTNQRIKMDIKNMCMDDIKIVSVRILPFFVFAFLGLIILFIVKAEIAAILSMCLFTLIATITWFAFTRNALRLIQKANKNDFEIVIDDWCGREERRCIDKFMAYEQHIRLALNRPYRLFFMKYGEYQIPKKQNYRWSNTYKMSAKEVFNNSVNGDKCYLILIDNQKIVMAYNTKFFELKD